MAAPKRRKVPTCYMCHRPPVPLTAERDGQVYVNAEKVRLFCSLRCAANYALLWGAPAVEENEHFCQVSHKWQPTPATDCTLNCTNEE